MKSNSLIKIDASVVGKKNRSLKKANSVTMMSFADDMENFWELYEAQLKRNGDLMKIIDKQQQFIQKVMSKGALMNLDITPEGPLVLNEQALPEFKDMSVQKLFKCSAYFKKIFYGEVKRLDGMHGIIKLLYTIKQLGGSANAHQLFDQTKVGKSTGFRNAKFLLRKHLIKKTGLYYEMQYTITKWGNELLNCTLENGYDKPINHYQNQEEGMKAWEHYFELK